LSSTGNLKQERVHFLHLPIVDGGITSDVATLALVRDCCARARAGEKLYIHCWGGHGRTGTLVSLILAELYNLSADQALRACQRFHDSRLRHDRAYSPATLGQHAQVHLSLHLIPPIFAPPLKLRVSIRSHAVGAVSSLLSAVYTQAECAGD
jgi:hypothetical protein